MDVLSSQHSLCISTFVHDINFSQDTDSSETLGIKLSCHLETIGGRDIGVC
jgi:hypothetical protein